MRVESRGRKVTLSAMNLSKLNIFYLVFIVIKQQLTKVLPPRHAPFFKTYNNNCHYVK